MDGNELEPRILGQSGYKDGPADLVQGATVDLKVFVRNNTGVAQTNARVDLYYTDPRISLEFPNPSATLIKSVTGLTIPAAGATVTVK